ncbi:MAG: VCBS repeat-containing protein, partial [Acidobacteria bacterium]|nr:VCBS repeat-containing protein [Acidobacteriota bacterium]
TNFSDDTATLYRNNGNGTFDDVTFSAGLGLHTQYLGWGTMFFDFDNDGWPDLLLVNGHVYPEVDKQHLGSNYREPKILYHNNGNGTFSDISAQAGSGIGQPSSARGLAIGDLWNNGQLSAVISNMNAHPNLLVNQLPSRNHWIAFRLIGTRSNRDGIGARVNLKAEGRVRVDEVRSGSSYSSNSDSACTLDWARPIKLILLKCSGRVVWLSDSTTLPSILSTRSRRVAAGLSSTTGHDLEKAFAFAPRFCVSPRHEWRLMRVENFRLLSLRSLVLAALVAWLSLSPRAPQSLAAQTKMGVAPDPWWKHAVIYEIYPRSFQDSNDDGVGDLNGITARLDYLKELGIDAIWITPFFPSPQVDFGYDISDYQAIDPQYGTMADFDRLASEARKRNIRIILDYVANHTSDQHPWFLESRSSRNNPKRDWYIWRNGREATYPPNNWQSWFGHSAWTQDQKTNQWYYHYFYIQQPDLNWRNPEVRQAMYDVLRFWLARGASGFRMDAVSRLFEDPGLHDDPILPGKNAFGDPNIQHKYTQDLPEVHEVMREIRTLVDGYAGNPVLISEADEPTIEDLVRQYGTNNDEVQLPMDFQVADVNRLSAPEFRKLLDEIEFNVVEGQPYFFFSNHDQARIWDRYGDGSHNDQIAKLMAALLLTTRATPQMYYGEELGMRTTTPTRREDVKDPVGRTGWPKDKGRDGERTPMQWDSSRNAGFSKATRTWLPLPPTATQYNVAVEERNPDSILNFYKQVIRLRRDEPALREGDYVAVNRDDQNVLAYVRKSRNGKDAILIALNMSPQSQTVSFKLQGFGVGGDSLHILVAAPPQSASECSLHDVELPPLAVLIAAVK